MSMSAPICQHCSSGVQRRLDRPAVSVLVWGYPDETYTLEAALCSGCADRVRERAGQGHVHINEDKQLA